MGYLITGLILFTGVHLVPGVTAIRNMLVSRMGESVYKAIYSVIALAGLGLIIYGKAQAGFVALWEPPGWGKHVTFVLMPVSILLLAAANMPSNIKRLTQNPMLWGVLLWSVGHLFANGEKASVLLFGGFGLFAITDLVLVSQRTKPATQAKLPVSKDVILVVASGLAFLALIVFHANLFGVAIR